MAFTKFPALIEMERRYGANVGVSYTTDKAAKEFIMATGDVMNEEWKDALT